MAFPTVDVNLLAGQSQNPQPGFDYYSGLILYGTAPSVVGKWNPFVAMSIVIRTQQMFAPEDAISAGIIPFSDNSQATGAIECGDGLGSLGTIVAGDKIIISCSMPQNIYENNSVVLCTYLVTSADVTDTTGVTLAANIAAAINSQSLLAGDSDVNFEATPVADTVVLAAPASAGMSLNAASSLSISVPSGNTFTNTITDFSGGTSSDYAAWYYHIAEYFRINITGNLTVAIVDLVTASSSNFNEIFVLEKASSSKIRQIGIYDVDATRGTAVNIVDTIQTIQQAAMLCQKTMPVEIIYSPSIPIAQV